MASRLSSLAKSCILAATLVLTGLALVIGRDPGPAPISLSVGEPAPQAFYATAKVDVPTSPRPSARRSAAVAAVEDVYSIDTQVTETVLASIAEFFCERP
jgi:hypothetical protein